jgi:hypothetical protein
MVSRLIAKSKRIQEINPHKIKESPFESPKIAGIVDKIIIQAIEIEDIVHQHWRHCHKPIILGLDPKYPGDAQE